MKFKLFKKNDKGESIEVIEELEKVEPQVESKVEPKIELENKLEKKDTPIEVKHNDELELLKKEFENLKSYNETLINKLNLKSNEDIKPKVKSEQEIDFEDKFGIKL